MTHGVAPQFNQLQVNYIKNILHEIRNFARIFWEKSKKRVILEEKR